MEPNLLGSIFAGVYLNLVTSIMEITMKRSETGMMEQMIPYEMISLESMGLFMFFGEVNQDSAHAACEFILKGNMLLEDAESLTMVVNSEGGSVSDGFAVIDMMECSALPIQTIGTGLIASMGLLILAAGSKGSRILTHNTEILAHQFSGVLYGKQHEMVAAGEAHARLEQQFIQHFLRHSKMTEKQIKATLFAPSDRYLTPQECKKYGLCDIILAPEEAKALIKKQSSPGKKSAR